MPIRIETEIPHKAEKVWAVVGTPDRIDWVTESSRVCTVMEYADLKWMEPAISQRGYC